MLPRLSNRYADQEELRSQRARDLERLRVRMLGRFGGVDPDAPLVRPPRSCLGRDMFTFDGENERSDRMPLGASGEEDPDVPR